MNVAASRPKKSLGQNFLMHARIAERIAKTAGIMPGTVVFEIGPGTGILTHELLKRAKEVVALEADSELAKGLHETFVHEIDAGRLKLLVGDVRTFDIDSLPKGYMLVANIPYYLTGDIFRRFLDAHNQPQSMTLLIQKEVAERIARSKKESVLSLSVKAYGTPAYEFTVPRGAFHPAPNVDSAVLSVRDITRRHFNTKQEEEHFFALVHAGFAHKRKRLKKNLLEAGFAAAAAHASENTRAEDVSLNEWFALL